MFLVFVNDILNPCVYRMVQNGGWYRMKCAFEIFQLWLVFLQTIQFCLNEPGLCPVFGLQILWIHVSQQRGTCKYNSTIKLEWCTVKVVLYYKDTRNKTLVNTCKIPNTMVSVYPWIQLWLVYRLAQHLNPCGTLRQLAADAMTSLNTTKYAKFDVIIPEHDFRQNLEVFLVFLFSSHEQ